MPTPNVRDTAHPYYGAEGEPTKFDSLDELIDTVNGYDADMNHIYRWDWNQSDPDDYEDDEEVPGETLTLFVILQRKSRCVSWTVPVTPDDEPRVREFLASDRVLGALRSMWAPLL